MNDMDPKRQFLNRDEQPPPLSTASVGILLLVLTLWIATRPYHGIIHDSRFYAIQAINEVSGGRFNSDLYFQYGSQGAFTLFTKLYKPFLELLGLADSNLILTIAAHALWLTGLFSFARAALDGWKAATIGVAAVILLPGAPNFQYGEPFLTPRLFSEAITFWALGSMLQGKPIRAALLLIISLALHPLMTLPGAAVLFIYESQRRPRLWWIILAATGAFLLLAFSGLQPFSRLRESFDPEWFSIVRIRNYAAFLTLWNFTDWLLALISFLLAAFAFLMTDAGNRRLLGSVLIVSLAGMAISLFAGDWLRNVFVVDIQAWRSTWLLAIVAHLFVGPLLFKIPIRGAPLLTAAPFLFALAITLLALSQFEGALAFGADAMVIVAVAACSWEKYRNQALPRGLQIAALALAGMAAFVVFIGLRIAMASAAADPMRGQDMVFRIALCIAASGVMAVLLYDGYAIGSQPLRMRAAIFAATSLAALAIFIWDQRTPWVKFIDTAQAVPAGLSARLPGTGAVYWDGDVTVPWFLLKRPSYFSCDQGTGVLFSRGTAIAYQRRFAGFQKLHSLDFGLDSNCPSAFNGTAPGPAELTELCIEQKGLQAIILTRPIAGAPAQIWTPPVRFEGLSAAPGRLRRITTDKFFIYTCSSRR